jgi:hypothetical protein
MIRILFKVFALGAVTSFWLSSWTSLAIAIGTHN